MRHARALALLLLALALPFAVFGQARALRRPPRPVTDLRITKSGSDAVLTWTITPAGTYTCLVTRGLLQPDFRAEKIVAVLDPGVLTWTDTGALTRTVLGVPVDEFYRVYTLRVRGVAGQERAEYLRYPRDKSLVMGLEISNGTQFRGAPSAAQIGRDPNWTMPSASSSSTVKLFDAYNFPNPLGPGSPITLNLCPDEENPSTVDHAGYSAGLFGSVPEATAKLTATTVRAIPTPSVSRLGQIVTVTWTTPTEDVPGTIVALEVWRTNEGVADGETGTLVATVGPAVTFVDDNIAAEPDGWFSFWQIREVYKDGSTSDFGASSSPIQR